MLNSDSQKQSILGKSEEKKLDSSKETAIIVDDTKKSEPTESSAHFIGVLQNSNAQTGIYEIFDRFVVFEAIRSLCITYWTLIFSFFDSLMILFFLNR